jgi:nitrous oxide reductase accessory protein NosL
MTRHTLHTEHVHAHSDERDCARRNARVGDTGRDRDREELRTHSAIPDTDRGPVVPRRPLLAAGAGALAALAGCGGRGDGEPPDPITLTEEHACDVCGMVVPRHPGPSAEVFYAGERPSGHDNPARFDSTWEAFRYDFDRQDRGWTRQAFYVTDYSAVDYTLTPEGDDLLISTHPEAEAFVDAADVTFVVASEVIGAMGTDLIAFSDRDEAESFRAEHGGELATFDQVTPTMISQLGGA